MAALSTQPTAPAPQPAKSSAPSPAFQRFATSIFSRRAAPRDWRWNDDTLHSAVHIYAQYSMTFDHPKPPPHVLKLLDHEPTRTRLPDLAEYRRTLTEEAKAKKMNASGFWAMQCASLRGCRGSSRQISRTPWTTCVDIPSDPTD